MSMGYVAAGLIGGQLLGGAGGGGGGSPTQTVTNYNAVSGYAAPYVENMLGATQGLLYNTDAEGKPTGLKGYEAFPGQRTALFTDLQNEAFKRGANMNVMGQTGQATDLANRAGLGALGMQYDPMTARADTFGNRQAAQYMSPYLEQALAPQLREAQRASDILGQQNQARAVGQGAFGGSRSALVEAERQRNLGTQMGDITARGFQTAYEQAANQFNQDAQRRMQAQQANIGQQQFGANLGLQGLQTGLAAAGQLGTLGQQQYAQQTGNINLMNQLGTQQQQQQQNILNQQYQDFLAQKQDPYNKLAFQQSMLSGLPITSNVQNVYSNPNMLSQVAGLGLAGAATYNAFNTPGALNRAKGGEIKEKRPAGLAELAIYNMA